MTTEHLLDQLQTAALHAAKKGNHKAVKVYKTVAKGAKK